MIQTGIIKEITKDYILITFYKDSACSHCNSCSPENKMGSTIKIDVPHDKIFLVGDEVTLKIDDGTILKLSLITYIVPAILMIVGYFFGANLLGLSENYSIVWAFIFLILSFLGLYFYDKRRVKNFGSDIEIL